MIQTNAFDYINVLNRAADAAWQRNEAISNNIANAAFKMIPAKEPVARPERLMVVALMEKVMAPRDE